jgi:hypothetical protein
VLFRLWKERARYPTVTQSSVSAGQPELAAGVRLVCATALITTLFAESMISRKKNSLSCGALFCASGSMRHSLGKASSLDYEFFQEKKKNGIMEKVFFRKNEFSLNDRPLWCL